MIRSAAVLLAVTWGGAVGGPLYWLWLGLLIRRRNPPA